MNLYASIKQTTLERFGKEYTLPPFYHSVIGIMEKAYLFQRAFKDYTFSQRIEGIALDFLSDYSLCIKMTLIAKCADDLFFQYKQVHDATCALKKAWKNKFYRYRAYNIKLLATENHKYSASFWLKFQIQKEKLLIRYKKILKCFL